MKIKNPVFVLLAAWLPCVYLGAQSAAPNASLANLQHFVTQVKPQIYDSAYTDLHFLIGDNIHYLYPIYQLLGSQKNLAIRN